MRNSLRPFVLVLALTGLLLTLAVLQYRWIGQVSEAERTRMQGSLQLAADQFRQAFSHEVTAAALPLQASPERVRAQDWASLAAAQTEWLASAPGAHLVSAVYLYLPDAKETFLELDPGRGVYQRAAVPPGWQPMLDRLQAVLAERRPGPPRGPAWVMNTGAELSDPILVHLLTQVPGEGFRRDHDRDQKYGTEREPPPMVAGAQLLVLSRSEFTGKVFPELAARYFGTGAGAEPLFHAQIVSGSGSAGSGRQLLFRSAGAPATAISEPDLELDLIEGRFPRGGFADAPREHRAGLRDWRFRPREGPPPAARPFMPALLLSGDGASRWKLLLRHPSGSVAAAVNTLRWRNLALSFAILLVLGTGMLTIVRNTRKAQRLADLQMEFVAGISHELRTPLAVIASAAENLSDGVVESTGQVQQYGALICNESWRLSGMMEQILQFAAGQKRKPYKAETLRAEELVEAALALSQTTLNAAGFTVERRIAANLPCVRGERGALTQCLQNLIANAAKYSGDSRTIAIEANAVKDAVLLTVEDHGIGIDPSDMPHLFDAFYRAKAVRSAQIHGTGLGLNLAQSFAREAGGEITVQSTLHQGSRFTLRLPAVAGEALEGASLVDRTA